MTMSAQNDDLGLDLLVDGELSEEDRRQLLTSLENEPGGWRRCALAFLESQCWKQSLDKLPVQPAPPAAPVLPVAVPPTPSVIAASVTPSRAHAWPGRSMTALAMAASFLLALWLGTLVRDAAQPSRGLPGDNQFAQQPQGPRSFAGLGPSAAGPWQMVNVSAPSAGAQSNRSFSVPAVERDNIDDQWLGSLPPAIPEEVLKALSRTGHQVQQRRQLVPVPLQDGRRLIMPVDEVDVNYIGNQSY
jgi:hypothetical protein